VPYVIGLGERRKKVLQDELKHILPQIISLGVEKVILFGSLVRDTIHRSSDIDLIVIKKTDRKFLDRLEELYRHLTPRVGIDILVYTPEEFGEMMQSNDFIKSVLKEGRVLYER
jgi:predicted nucleotidyltransferase